MLDSNNNIPEQNSKLMLWLKRLGVAGFLFFLLKGLIWIAVFYGVGKLFK